MIEKCTQKMHEEMGRGNLGLSTKINKEIYRAFHRFGQVKYPDGGSILGSSQYSKLQLPPKIQLNSKGVKIDQKIIISLH